MILMPSCHRGFSKVLGVFLIIAVIAAGGAGFYYYRIIKSPQYSLNIILKSAQTHDIASFEQHADLRSIYNSGLSAFSEALLGDPEMKDNPFAGPLMMVVKKVAAPILIENTKAYVETGKIKSDGWLIKESDADKISSNITEAVGRMAEATDWKNLALQPFAKQSGEDSSFSADSSINGKIAVVTLNFDNEKENKHFKADLRMRQLENGEWCLIEIANLKEMLEQVHNGKK
jgi:hypothetical protein